MSKLQELQSRFKEDLKQLLREKLEETRSKIKNSIDGVMSILGAELVK